MTLKKARKEKLSTIGAAHFNGKVILDVEYPSNGGRQSTSLAPSKTALSIKKGDKVDITTTNGYISKVKANGRNLKAGW